MKPDDLAAKSKKDLLELAKKHSIAGRSAMSKDELARAISRSAAASSHSSKSDSAKAGAKKRPAAAKPAASAKPAPAARSAAKSDAKAPVKKAAARNAAPKAAEKHIADRPAAEKPPSHEPKAVEPHRAPEHPRHEAGRPEARPEPPRHEPPRRDEAPPRREDRMPSRPHEGPRGDAPQRPHGPKPPMQGGRPPQRGPMDKRGGPHDSRGPRRGMPPIDPAMKLSRVEEIRRDSPGRGGRPGGRYPHDTSGPRGRHDRGPGGRDDRRPPMRGDRFPQRGPGAPPPPHRGSLAEERAQQAREHLRRSGDARHESPYTPQYDRPHDRPHDRSQDRSHDRRDDRRPERRDDRRDDRSRRDRPRDRSGRDRHGRDRGEPRRDQPRLEAPRTAPIPERFVSQAPERRPEPPQAPRPAGIEAGRPPDMPAAYGVDRLAIMVRDPYWLHAYWEVTQESIERAREQLGERWEGHRWILRVHTYAEGNIQAGAGLFDIDVRPDARNWYFRVPQPDSSYEGMIGVLTRDGTFYPFARSNRVRTPRDTASDVTDVQWATTREEFEKIYALSGGHTGSGSTSGEIGEEARRRSEEAYFSGMLGSMGSGSMGAPKHRGFWFQVNTELILYGATEPGAKVQVQGRTIELRPDGTFTLRFQLPDGVQDLPCVATSSDGISEKTITPVVRRQTSSSERELNPNPGDAS